MPVHKGGTTPMNMVDATEPLTLTLKMDHVRAGRRKDRKDCPLFWAGREQAHITDISVDRNIVRVKFRGHDHWTRYMATPTSKAFVAAMDRRTIQHMRHLGILTIPEEGVRITLGVPRPSRSIAHMRSDAEKAKRLARTRKAEAKKKALGLKSRDRLTEPAADSITMQDIRSGQGYRD